MPLGILYLLQHRFEALFELSSELGTGNECAHVEGNDFFVLQPLGHIPAHDALSEPFDDGGLSHPGLTNQDRVVLGPPGKNLDDPSDLVVTADDGIDLSLARQLGQIAPILLEGLVGRLRVLARYPLTASNGLQDLENVVSRDAITLEESSWVKS